MIRRDYRDTVIETQADSEALLRARILSLEADIDAYKTIAIEAIARLHEHRVKQQRLEARLQGLRDEIRRYTAATVSEAKAA